MRLFMTYSLRPETDVEEFKRWSREVDAPACRAKPVCSRFEVYLSDGGEGAPLPFVIEDLDVDSVEGWEAAVAAPDHAEIAAQWNRFVQADTLVSMHCTKV